MRVQMRAAMIASVLMAGAVPAMAQPPTCSSVGGTMTCTFPAGGGGGGTWLVNGANIYAPNAGNVGIGTSTPGVLLDVTKAQGSALRIFNSGAGNANTTAEIAGSTSAGSFTDRWGIAADRATLAVSTQYGATAGALANFYSTSGGAYHPYFFIGGDGNVGVGTTTPGVLLDVRKPQGTALRVFNAGGGNANNTVQIAGSTSAGTFVDQWGMTAHRATLNVSTQYGSNAGALANFYSTGGNVYQSYLYIDGGGYIGMGTTAPTQRLHVIGNIAASGSISAYYQDVAEWVPVRDALPPGTVVVATDGGVVSASQTPYDTKVVGVVSPQPGIMLGEAGPDKALVAQSGRVRVKVDASPGAIHVGDLLVTSPKPGTAMRSEPVNAGGVTMHRPGTLLGKALEALPNGEGEILVLLTLQ